MNSASPDWSLWRSFSAVVADGSLSAAARSLGLSQPTVGRHIEALEQGIGSTLFERTLSGLKPNATALRLFEQVEIAKNALSQAAIMAEGRNTQLAGTVRITASTVASHYSLPPILRQLREEFAAIAIELVPSDSPENLLLRESDIAVRMFRPRQLELITRKVGDSQLSCCAHQSYIDLHGQPETPDELIEHNMIGYDRSEILINAARGLGYDLKRENFQIRTDSQTGIWELTKAGLGVSFAQNVLIDATLGMRRLLPSLHLPPLEVWLTTHRELFTSRRIRVIYDRLAELLSAYYAESDKEKD